MDCDQIREELSGYLDDVLDAAARQKVAAHLDVCPACRGELKGLQSLVSAMGDLEKVSAPPDFLEQLHARMTPAYRVRRFLKNLFLPFRLKWPVQLTTALAMGVLVFFITQTVPVRKQEEAVHQYAPLREVLEKEAEETSRNREVDASHQRGEQTLADSAPPAPEAGAMHKDVAPAPMAGRSEVRAKKAAPPISFEVSKSDPDPAMLEQAAPTATAPLELALIVRPENPPMGSAYMHEKQPDDGAPAKLKQRKIESKDSRFEADLEPPAVANSFHPPAQQQSVDLQVGRLLKSLDGNLISVSPAPKTHLPESLLVELPSHRLGDFIAGLQKFGALRTPVPELGPTAKERIRVRILLVTP